MDNVTSNKHESYGNIKIIRNHHNVGVSLFGSSIENTNTITLSIHPATLERSISHDHYYGKNQSLIEVEMTPAQFTDMITSINLGSGTPVTIRSMNNHQLERPPFENKRDVFENELEVEMNKTKTKLQEIKETTDNLLVKKTINKQDKEILTHEIDKLIRLMQNDLPFIETAFKRQMDQSVNEAKKEFDTFVETRLQDHHTSNLQKNENQYTMDYILHDGTVISNVRLNKIESNIVYLDIQDKNTPCHIKLEDIKMITSHKQMPSM